METPYETQFDGHHAYVSRLDNGDYHVACQKGAEGHSSPELRYAVKAYCEEATKACGNSYGRYGCQPEVDGVEDAKWISLNPNGTDTAEVAIKKKYEIRVKMDVDKTWVASCGNFTANEDTAELAVWAVTEQLSDAIDNSMESL